MNKNIMNIFCSGILVAATFFTQSFYQNTAEAAPVDSDTSADLLNYISERDYAKYDNVITDEQKKLLDDAYKMRQNLRNKLDPTKNVPIALEGEEMFYNQGTGDVLVNGNVQLTTLDQRRLTTEKIQGNIENSTVEIDGEVRLLQMTPEQARIVLTGYKTQYNYTRGLGKMENIDGKVDDKYIKSKRIEFYPDLIIIYNGYATKCSAKNPDYRMQADKIEIYPDGKMISYNVKYYIGNILVYHSRKETTDPNKEDNLRLPKVGYNQENGFWLSDSYTYNITDRVDANLNLAYYEKQDFKGNGNITWNTKSAGTFKLYTGIFEDSNNKWTRKSPTFNYSYSTYLGKSPIKWFAEYENGIWHQGNNHARHISYKAGLSTDAILAGTWRIYPTIDYSILEESGEKDNIYQDKKTYGFDYSISAVKDYDDRWSQYIKYAFDRNNKNNMLIEFNTDESSRRLDLGFSYRADKNNRFVIGYNWDMVDKKLDDIDYYWFHQMHCLELITRYRAKRDSFDISLSFTPW